LQHESCKCWGFHSGVILDPRQWRCIAGQGAPASQKECVAFSYESYSVRKATCSRIHLLSPTWHRIRPYNPIILCTKLSWCHLLFPHTVLLYKLSTCGFSYAYVSWWCSYLTSPYFTVRIHAFYSIYFELLSSDHQGSLLDSIFFRAFINDFCNSIKLTSYFYLLMI
jgi:hypothetical protein